MRIFTSMPKFLGRTMSRLMVTFQTISRAILLVGMTIVKWCPETALEDAQEQGCHHRSSVIILGEENRLVAEERFNFGPIFITWVGFNEADSVPGKHKTCTFGLDID